MADLTLTNCNLDQRAAIGGNGNFTSGGGLGAGGSIYIDRGNTLTLLSTDITSCKAQGGNSSGNMGNRGGGASFSDGTKNIGGDYVGTATAGGAYDGSRFLTGYGGGRGSAIGGAKSSWSRCSWFHCRKGWILRWWWWFRRWRRAL